MEKQTSKHNTWKIKRQGQTQVSEIRKFSSQIEIYLISHSLDPTLGITPFIPVPTLFLMMPDEFQETWDECSCSDSCFLDLIAAVDQ